MWSRTATGIIVMVLLQSTLLLAGCGGSSTPQREPAPAPSATPNPDVGRTQAEREAALRRQAAPASPASPEPTTEPAANR